MYVCMNVLCLYVCSLSVFVYVCFRQFVCMCAHFVPQVHIECALHLGGNNADIQRGEPRAKGLADGHHG